jgi:hypothetical protein
LCIKFEMKTQNSHLKFGTNWDLENETKKRERTLVGRFPRPGPFPLVLSWPSVPSSRPICAQVPAAYRAGPAGQPLHYTEAVTSRAPKLAPSSVYLTWCLGCGPGMSACIPSSLSLSSSAQDRINAGSQQPPPNP